MSRPWHGASAPARSIARNPRHPWPRATTALSWLRWGLLAGLTACGGSTSPSLAGAETGSEPGSGTGPATGSKQLTVVVAVVDSLMPQEIGATTPNLARLQSEGTLFPESRAVFSAETLPNHVAMMTGVYPRRNGIATNNFLDFQDSAGPVARDLSLPEELTAPTLFTWVDRQCRQSGVYPGLRTGATLSKKYLHEVFAGDAADPVRANRHPAVFNVPPDTHWDPTTSPAYVGPGFEYTPDAATMNQALVQLPGADVLFLSLGDVDRFAHALGTPARAGALATADAEIGRLRDALERAGRWADTVLFVVSDHGTDIATNPFTNAVTTQPTLDALATCFGPLQAVQNGGTDSLYATARNQPLAQRQAALRAVRACLLGTQPCETLCPGATRPANAARIANAWYTSPDPLDPDGTMPPELGADHPNLGDLVLAAEQGFKFAEPSASANPLPGNHGHPATFRNTVLVAGGSPWVRRGQVVTPSRPAPTPFERLPEQAENVDITPTIAWLLGLGIQPADFPDGVGFDGRVLREAFVQFDAGGAGASPTRCGRFD